jgi:hypothetical protein|tara:strand:+ start:313 stop:570 length:258 start_codon:yes stop_codon:yes gene_type:complete
MQESTKKLQPIKFLLFPAGGTYETEQKKKGNSSLKTLLEDVAEEVLVKEEEELYYANLIGSFIHSTLTAPFTTRRRHFFGFVEPK